MSALRFQDPNELPPQLCAEDRHLCGFNARKLWLRRLASAIAAFPLGLAPPGSKLTAESQKMSGHAEQLYTPLPGQQGNARPRSQRQGRSLTGLFSPHLLCHVCLASLQIDRNRGMRIDQFPLAASLAPNIGRPEGHFERFPIGRSSSKVLHTTS